MNSVPALETMLTGLIGTPSVSSTNAALDMGNLPVIELLAGWLEVAGYAVQILPVPGESNKANLVATLGQGSGGLILAGHSDTVPCDPHLWRHDPFKLNRADERYYGLGTSDMKSFLALAIEAASTFDVSKFKRPLTILATADEETSMSGARALTARDLETGSYAVIGEPTGMRPVHQHKGILMERITFTGSSGHSSDPSLGNNALEGMHEAMTVLLNYREELQKTHHDTAFAVPVPTMNLGHIHGGDNPNRICGACELELDLRPIPGMDLGNLRKTLRQRVSEVAERRGLQCDFTMLFAGINPMQTDITSPIIKAAEDLTDAPSQSVAFGTEGPFFNSMGIDTVILGPGDIAQAHQPDEYLALDRIPPMVAVLRRLIQKFCLN